VRSDGREVILEYLEIYWRDETSEGSGRLPAGWFFFFRAACERVEEDAVSSAIARVSLTLIGYKND